MYHVGRPGHERTMDRVLKAWGIDGHNSHTNVCSSSARLGYALWRGYDRPSPDHAHARFILLLSSHLEAGHYFNPHAQRIIEGKLAGAKLAVMDPRLSNTASMADYWLPTYPGSEAAVLLAMASVILDEGLADLDYVERWTNWREYMADRHRGRGADVRALRGRAARSEYREFTPEFAEAESGVARRQIVEVARLIGAARGAFASHVWRGSGERQPGRLAGRARAAAPDRAHRERRHAGRHVARTPGTSTSPSSGRSRRAQKEWNELLFPKEWPLSHYEMSFLLPHFLKEGRGKLDIYFTRVYNPVWTNPDGMTWMEVLQGRGAGGPARRPHADLERDRDLRRLRAAHGPRRRAPRHPEPGDAVRASGSASASPCCAPRASGWARRSATPTRPIRARSGRRTSSGSSSPGASTPTARSASARWFESPYRAGREADRRRVLPLDLRERGPGPARGRGARRAWPPSSTCGATAPS